ncbi:MAG: flippase [Patescibacteria group bacterium]|nr:flippase [Patescibacteria group bacterium]
MSVSRKIAYNVAVSSVTKILSTVLALVGIGLITRYLGQDIFGLYVIAIAFFLFFESLGDWGLHQTVTREISRPNANEKEIMSKIAGLRIAISLLVIIVAPLIIFFLPYSIQLKQALVIISFAFFFSSLRQLLIGLFQKRLLMDRVSIAELIGKIIQVALIFAGVKLNLGFNFIVSTLLVTMAFNFFVVLWLSRKFLTFKPSIDTHFWKKFLKQSLPIGMSVFITFIYFKADSIILSFLQPAQAVGIYGASYKIIENLSFFPSMIVGLTMPILAYNVFSNRKKFELVVNKNFKIFLILVFPLIIGTLFLADGIINVIVGSGFEESVLVLRIIIFSIAFIFFGNLFNNILIAAKFQKELFCALSVCAIFNLTANILFIPKYSYIATSYTSVATELLVIVLGSTLIYKKLGFIPKFEGIASILLSSGIMAFYLWLFSNLPFFVLAATSPLVYFISLFVLKGIKKEELLLLLQKD